MRIEKPTIVTALFDIGRDTWDGYDLSYGTYLYWMKAILMYDMPMVIYTDEKLYDEIRKNRMVCDPNLEKTIFEIKKLEDLVAHQTYYTPVSELMASDEFKSKIHFNVPEMTKPLYNIVIFNKLFYIKESIMKKHFDSDFYIWADAGVLRHEINEPISNWPNLEKINDGYSDKITFFNHQDEVSVGDHKFHLFSQYRYIHGGCFFIPNNGVIDELIGDFTNYIDTYLNEGVVGSEEKYYDFCYTLKPDSYNTVKSDWRQYFNIFS
jgi:hypothetical protein